MRLVLIIISVLSTTIYGNAQTISTFSEEVIDTWNQIDPAGFRPLLKKYEDNNVKHLLISRQISICEALDIPVITFSKSDELGPEDEFLRLIQNSWSYSNKQQYYEANKTLDSAELFIFTKKEKALHFRVRARIYKVWRNFHESIKYLNYSQNIYQETESEAGLLILKCDYFDILLSFNRWDQFSTELISYYKKNKENISQYPFLHVYYLNLLSIRASGEGLSDSTIFYLKSFNKLAKHVNDSLTLAVSNLELASTYLELNSDSVVKYLNDYKESRIELSNHRNDILTEIYMMSFLIDNKYQNITLELLEYSSMDDYFISLWRKLSQVDDDELALMFLESKTKYYESKNASDSVLVAVKLQNKLLNALQREDTISTKMVLYQLELEKSKRFRLMTKKEKAELENSMLNLKLEKQRQEKLVYIVATILLLIIFFSYIYYSKRLRKEQLEKTKSELEMLETKTQLSESELQLEEFREMLVKKSQIIESYASRIDSNDDNQEFYKSEIQKMKILTEEDWLKFQKLFANAFPNFKRMLIEYDIKLTDGERRIFMLHKMNFERQQISQVLGIGKEGVRKATYRLKKKINPNSLEDLLQKF